MVPSLLCTFVAHITFLHVFFLPPPFISFSLSLSRFLFFSLSLSLSLSLYLCPLFLSVVARHMSSDALYQIFSSWSILLFHTISFHSSYKNSPTIHRLSFTTTILRAAWKTSFSLSGQPSSSSMRKTTTQWQFLNGELDGQTHARLCMLNKNQMWGVVQVIGYQVPAKAKGLPIQPKKLDCSTLKNTGKNKQINHCKLDPNKTGFFKTWEGAGDKPSRNKPSQLSPVSSRSLRIWNQFLKLLTL